MGKNVSPRNLGLRLVWISQAFNRERSDVQWYATGTTRDAAREKFAAEKIGGKPKFIRIEDVAR